MKKYCAFLFFSLMWGYISANNVPVNVFNNDNEARLQSNNSLVGLKNFDHSAVVIDEIIKTQPTVAYAVLDYNTGKLVAGYNQDRIQFPASITKVMTLFIAFDKLTNGSIKLDDKIKVSLKASQQPTSKLGLRPGSTISVKDALVSIIVSSSNDVSYALAEHIAGNIPAFIVLMNKKAKEIGMVNTNFSVVTGLPNANNYSSAYDLSIMARALMIEHNPYYIMFSIKSFMWSKYLFTNSNPLLKYSNIDGIKTGFTNAAGYTLLTSAQSPDNSTRVIVAGLGFKTKESRELFIKHLSDTYLPMAEKERNNNILAINKPTNLPTEDAYVVLEDIEDNNTYSKQVVSTGVHVSGNNYPIVYNDYTKKLVNANSVSISPSHSRLIVRPKKKRVVTKRVPKSSATTNTIKPVANQSSKDQIKSATVKKVSYNSVENNKGYIIQVGAFSSYNFALNAINKLYKTKEIEDLLKNSTLSISESDKGLYRVRFNNLTKYEANKACVNLNLGGINCYIV